MEGASISEIKKELKTLPAEKLVEVAVRLAKYKKENKELLTYLLFESEDERSFITDIKRESSAAFEEINTTNWHYIKKSVRKILRGLNRNIRYSGIPSTAIELRIHFCRLLKESGLKYERNAVLSNMYDNEIKKILKLIDGVHEDLQQDFLLEVQEIKK